MAEQQKKRAAEENESAAYLYDYDDNGTAALQPEPESIPEPEPQRKKQPAKQPQAQPKKKSRKAVKPYSLENARVRPAERIAPLSVIGMVAVAIMAVLVLQSSIRLNSLNSDVVAASAELEELEETGADLEAQYEQLFDMQSIESDMLNSGKMISPGESQEIYLDLSEPDTSTSFETSGGIVSWFKEQLAKIAELFQ